MAHRTFPHWTGGSVQPLPRFGLPTLQHRRQQASVFGTAPPKQPLRISHLISKRPNHDNGHSHSHSRGYTRSLQSASHHTLRQQPLEQTKRKRKGAAVFLSPAVHDRTVTVPRVPPRHRNDRLVQQCCRIPGCALYSTAVLLVVPDKRDPTICWEYSPQGSRQQQVAIDGRYNGSSGAPTAGRHCGTA